MDHAPQAAGVCCSAADARLDRLGVGQIQPERPVVVAAGEGCDCSIEAVTGQVDRTDPCATLRQHPGNAAPDATGRARDNHRLALEA